MAAETDCEGAAGMKRNLLIVSSNAMDMAGLCAAFSNLEEIALLPPATG